MKRYIKNIVLASMGVAMVSSAVSCTDGFEEANTDPNKITVGEALPYHMLEPLIYNGANQRAYHTHSWNNELVQFTAFTGGTTNQVHRYYLSNAEFDRDWKLFARFAYNATHMSDLAYKYEEEQGGDTYKVYKAIALLIKVMNLEDLTCLFGDIPYDEAFQYRTGGTRYPKYDSQKDVYMRMFAELEEANRLFQTSSEFPHAELDGLYHGDISKWRKFNNSLYLRMLCRISGRDAELGGQVSAKMKEILANSNVYPIFESNDDNATVTFTGTSPYQNYFYNTTKQNFTTSSRKMTEQMVKMMVETDMSGEQGSEDPRLRIFYRKKKNKTENPDEKWLGSVGGSTPEESSRTDKGAAYLNYDVLCNAICPLTYMDYAEVEMILAEMAYKGLIDGGEEAAKLHYETAVRSSCERWEAVRAGTPEWDKDYPEPLAITLPEIQVFLSDNTLASWDLWKAEHPDDMLELIGNQKFLILFWNGYQAYHEIRRTNYPKLTIGKGNLNGDIFPTRMAYSQDSMGTNSRNCQAALDNMGGANDMKLDLWFSKNAIDRDSAKQ